MRLPEEKTVAPAPARYAVLGHPVAHSLSPRMHMANFTALGMSASYEAFDVRAEELDVWLAKLRRAGFKGLNLTIPLKARAIELVDEAAPTARRLGGVNTLLVGGDGRMTGHNTDGFGFVTALAEAGLPSLAGLRVLVVGCGGAGRALALTCAAAGAAEIALANRTAERAAAVARSLETDSPGVVVRILASDAAAWTKAARSCDLIVHTTSQGLRHEDPALLHSTAFHPGQMLFDAVYTAPRTPVMQAALAAGAHAINGLGMLLHQGAESFRIWTGREPDLAAMRAAIGLA